MTHLRRKAKLLIFHPFKRAARLLRRRITTLAQKAYLLLAFIMVVSFVASLASSLTPNTTISALLSNQSWDLEAMVRQASDTRPWNDNGARAYGPMTYRLTNLGASFAPNIGMPDVALFEQNATEPAHHFFLTMVAGLSALAVGWVIGCALTGNIASRLISSVVFGSALLQTEAWRHQLFTVHPDVVLAPFAAGLAYFLLKGVIEGRRAAYVTHVSVMLGMGLATKVSFIYFVPPIIGAYVSRNTMRMIMRLGFIAALAFLVYIAIGFPQTLFIHDVIGAMLDQRRVMAPVTTESMLRWSVMLFDVFVVIAGVMILLSFTIADSQLINMLGSAKPITFLTFTILALLPSLILICTMNFIPSFVSATSHYSIGFSAYTAVGVALIIAAIAFRMLSFLPERIQKIRKFIGPVILLSSIYITGATVPSYINDVAKMHETGRANDIRLIEKISFLSETGAVPLITPYFPNFELPGQEGLSKSVFEEKLSSLQGREYGLFLMIDYGWFSRFLEGEPTEYDLIDEYDNWLENKDLYTRLFAEGTLSGSSFERIYVQDTSQIWATQNLAKAYREKF